MVSVINLVIRSMAGILDVVIGFLPDSVLLMDMNSFSIESIPDDWIRNFNYFFPAQEILWFLEIFASVMFVYYTRIVILRIMRLIG